MNVDVVGHVPGAERLAALEAMQCTYNGMLHMTYQALRLSRCMNDVAMRHGEVSRGMFPQHTIDSVTNGVNKTCLRRPGDISGHLIAPRS
jgi:glycogen phosphorylase